MAVAKVVDHLTVFQRTPAWCRSRNDKPTSSAMAKQIVHDKRYIEQVHVAFNKEIDKFNDEINNAETNAAWASMISTRIQRQVHDRATATALTPTYAVGCKRVCIIDDYWPTFNRDHVQLVADSKGVNRVTALGPLMEDGTQHELDVLIFATGYEG